ncbi:MAG: hypothetical protein ACRC6R_02765 [Bacteroidales bacterium]
MSYSKHSWNKLKGNKARELVNNIPQRTIITLSYILLTILTLALLASTVIRIKPTISVNIELEADKSSVINCIAYIQYKSIIDNNKESKHLINLRNKDSNILLELDFKERSTFIYNNKEYCKIGVKLLNIPAIEVNEKLLLAEKVILPERSLFVWVVERFRYIESI